MWRQGNEGTSQALCVAPPSPDLAWLVRIELVVSYACATAPLLQTCKHCQAS